MVGMSWINKCGQVRDLNLFLPPVKRDQRHRVVAGAKGENAPTHTGCLLYSGPPTSLSRSAVLEWQVVTVALFHRSRSCMGAPTILLRPTTTACLPAICTPGREAGRHQRWRSSCPPSHTPPEWETERKRPEADSLHHNRSPPQNAPSAIHILGSSHSLGLGHCPSCSGVWRSAEAEICSLSHKGVGRNPTLKKRNLDTQLTAIWK